MAERPARAFEEPDVVAIMMAHVTRTAPSIEEVSPGVELPPGLEQLVRRGLEKAPDERIGSAAEYVRLLDEYARAVDEVSAPLVTPPIMSVVTPGPWRVSGVMPIEEPGPLGSGTMQSVPQARRARSIADAAPGPRGWLAVVGGVLGVVVLVAIVIAVASNDTRSSLSPAIDARSRAVLEPMAAVGDELEAALHELTSGKTCPVRKAAIAKLVELGDARAIPPLKAARYRMRGGLLGIGQRNTNQCLKMTADAAIETLSTPP